MKTRFILFSMLLFAAVSCSKDDDAAPSNKLTHSGEKWTITSVEYTIVDQGISNPAEWVKTGTATNAGAFYFNGGEGSFDILINNDRQEDYFGYSMDGSDVTIISVDQNISINKFSQNVIAFSGAQSGATMTLSGTFTSQGLTQQYVFTGDFVLTKE